ncbi:hypothetical protein EDD30_4183 [Couchioplanes caeruleus]|uniref:Uncharacterized protein n=2 Tax=Couchioplanes caeruleus TaxID=56438 RepID=A0A1K0G085_9ACTN|nr:hypothetical protein BG844_30450 [Couchioplanes caeruleus subsp. caeruleus]ROP31288.1 hypothetical protein EDD30_4183 [Couchioplanes caeruleus]
MHFDPAAAVRAMQVTRQHVDSASPTAPIVTDQSVPKKRSGAASREPSGLRLWIRRILRPAR